MTQSTPESLQPGIDPINAAAELVLSIVRTLVSQPDRVALRNSLEGPSKVILLTVAPQDLQTVLGERGRTAKSLRVVVTAIALKCKQRIALEIQGEDGACGLSGPR